MARARAAPTAGAASGAAEREIAPLLGGYWSFGQYWGMWVILVFEFQRRHSVSDSGIGLDYMILSAVAVVVMLFHQNVARLQGVSGSKRRNRSAAAARLEYLGTAV